MKKFPLMAIVPCLLVFFSACKNESAAPPAASGGGSGNTAPAAANNSEGAGGSGAEVTLYAVAVNDLLLRREPSQQSKDVITKFKQGELVNGTGEISTKKENATIRGIERNAPFIRVASTSGAQHTGWAFGAGLIPLYAGPRAASPDLAVLQGLTAHLRGLPVKQLDSGKKAWDYVRANFASAKGPLADAAAILLADFIRQMEIQGEFYKLTEQIQWTEQDYTDVHNDRFNVQKYPQTRQLAASGFALATAEGMVFPIADWAAIESFFGSKVTEPMKRYIHQQVVEQKASAMSDGGVVIPWTDIAERAAFWEQFVRQNPNFPLRDEASEQMRWYRFTLTNGADNTPIFGYEANDPLDAEVKKAWEMVLQQYPGTELARTIRQIYDLAKAAGWKSTAQIKQFQEQLAKEYMDGR